jgi:hemerythrin-like domain-containing protein
MNEPANRTERRSFLRKVTGVGAAFVVLARPRVSRAAEEEEVSATEDLMREHGILRRLLLVYGEAIRRIDAKQELKAESISQAGEIIRGFIENYHERDEEEYIFPRLRKAGKMTDLVAVLVAQHQAGRQLTAEILKRATTAGLASPGERGKLTESMRLFIRMYEPHSAREDTVLFPAFRELVGAKELDKLKDIFEAKEKALPGGGFEKMVIAVTKIEQSLGIADLAQFTPKAP